jgi:hypothetical protein
MARTLHQLTVFVSGPSTVEAEKAALRVVVDEINRRSEKTHAVTLRVVSWPDDIRPGVNADPQAEIEHQVGADFDIYVGVLGSRFGSPTTRGGSGTEQEFDQAVARFQTDSTSVRLLFYFKRDAEDPFSIDLSQLQKVRDFRERLGGKGVLYRDFRDTAEFTRLIREHIDGLIIDEWRGNKWLQVTSTVAPAAADPTPVVFPPAASQSAFDSGDVLGEHDELGVLEYMAAFHEASEALVGVMNAITRETERVGEQIRARSAETDEITAQLEKEKAVGGNRAQQRFLAQARETVDRAAGNLEDFASAMSPRVEEFKVQNRAMFDNMRHAFHAGAELGPRDSTEDREALNKLIPSIHQSREHVMAFQASISRVPALTGRFKRSRKRAAAILGEVVAEMSFSIQEATALLDEMGGPPETTAA